MLFSWLFSFFDFFFLENQNFGRKPYFSIWFLMIFSSGFSILYPGHEFRILITFWPRDLLHFVWVCASHNILMQFIYRDIWHISKFFPKGEVLIYNLIKVTCNPFVFFGFLHVDSEQAICITWACKVYTVNTVKRKIYLVMES